MVTVATENGGTRSRLQFTGADMSVWYETEMAPPIAPNPSQGILSSRKLSVTDTPATWHQEKIACVNRFFCAVLVNFRPPNHWLTV